MNTEILCWCLLGASAVMFICVIGFGGKIGNAFGDLLFGIMGTNAYLFPFLVFFLTLYLMMTHGERFAKIRAISCIVLFCVLCGVWQLISYSGLTGSSVSDYFEVGQQYHTGGGAIGGALLPPQPQRARGNRVRAPIQRLQPQPLGLLQQLRGGQRPIRSGTMTM